MTESTQKDQAAARKAYGAATQRLREAFRIEFDIFLTEEYNKAGVSVRRRKSAAEAEAEKQAKAAERAKKVAERAAAKVAKAEEALAKAREEAKAKLSLVPSIEDDEAMQALTDLVDSESAV